MQNWKAPAQQAVDYWSTQATDVPSIVNGFNGTWAISDYKLIPSSLMDFVSEMFFSSTKLSRVPMSDINKVLNDAWDGPGSMPKIINLTYQSRRARQLGRLNDDDAELTGNDASSIAHDLIMPVKD